MSGLLLILICKGFLFFKQYLQVLRSFVWGLLVQTIPRDVWLSPDGKQLLQWPVVELETLRGKKVGINKQILKQGDHVEVKGITAAQV